MLWLKDGDNLLFRSNETGHFEPGTLYNLGYRPLIRDVFGFFVHPHNPRLIYEGDICAVGLPDTCHGLSAFTITK